MRVGRLAFAALVVAGLVAREPFATVARAEVAPMPGTAAAGDPCGSETQLEALLARDPAMAARRSVLEAMVSAAQRNGLVPRPGGPTSAGAPIYTIPVVVHIVHDNGPENISDNQVLSQIAAINRDCQNVLNNALPAVDCQLKFCLATNGPTGNSINWPGVPGITRKHDAAKCIVQAGNNGSDIALKQVDYFPSNQYLNIWVVKQIQINGQPSGVVGYATFPGSVPVTQDGIVMDYRVMGADNYGGYGTFSTLLPFYTEGKVLAHEVGHWLDLFHTFHGGCSVGDQCADTPPEAINNWNCPTTTILTCGNTASNPDPIHNFMEYTNDPCRYQFTGDQRNRMHAAITTYRPQLVSLDNLSLVGVSGCPLPLIANVTLTPSQGCNPLTVQCSTPSCGGCTYSWTALGGTVANPTAQNTSASFSTAGPHIVTVTISDGSNNTGTASATVYVTDCQPISGRCANWVFGSNARLDFTSGYPMAVNGTSNTGPEECATQISNAAGSLLFYTDNERIWDITNNPMAGSMSGNNPIITSGNSSHTGAIVIPKPGPPSSLYYMFSVREAEQVAQPNPVTYHVIDMSMNGGLGALTLANQVISLPASSLGQPVGMLEGVTLIPNCNGTGWWLITAGARWNSTWDWQEYVYVTPVTSSGIGTTVAHHVGFFEANATSYSGWGTITATRDGTRFAICQAFSQSIHIYDFDRITGTPQLVKDTGDADVNQDVAFSPDGELVYYTYLSGNPIGNSGLGLYGLRQMRWKTLEVRTLRAGAAVTLPPDVELGPDDRIYSGQPGKTALDCVNYPNVFNSVFNNNECGYNPVSVSLGTGTVNDHGTLPNTLGICSPSNLPPAQFSYTITGCNNVSFKTTNCSPWNWTFGNFGSSSVQNPSLVVFPAGTHQVTLTTSGSPATVTKTITIGNLPVSIIGPSNACGGPNNYMAVGPSSYTYTWTVTNGTPATASGSNILVSWGPGGGTIQVTATDPATGCTSTASLTNDGCGSCTKPPADMVAWWPLDELAGPLAQEIVAANDGQDVNAPPVAAGAVGNCRDFPGTSAKHVIVNDHPKLDLGTSNLTIDAWIRSASGASFQTIVEKRTLTGNQGYALYLKDGRLALWLGDGSSGTEYTDPSTANLADGLWHHVAATEDRFDSDKGTRLYVDGSMILYQPGYSTSADVSNAEPLLIGAQKTTSSTTDWFVGRIDEVEIFSRALGADEVTNIWGAGSKGKCKEYTYVPSSQIVCEEPAYAIAWISICNFGPTASYNLTFAGLPTCAGYPTAVQFHIPQQNNPVGPIQSGQCLTIPIRITPTGLTPGQTACYTVTATNTTSNVVFVARGTVGVNYLLCPRLTSGGLSSGGIGTPRSVTWQLFNTSLAPRGVLVSVDARLADGTPPGPGMGYISLNGLPPGVPWTSNYFIDAGQSIDVTVDASFETSVPFRFFDLMLSTDIDGDGTYEMESSTGMLYSERAVPLTAVPPKASIARLELVGATPNPFRRELTVEFALPRRGAVHLALFDVGGRRVRTLIDESVAAGRSIRTLSGAGLASGVYFLRLEAGGQIRSRRVVMIRE
jgi:PKD repeat protein